MYNLVVSQDKHPVIYMVYTYILFTQYIMTKYILNFCYRQKLKNKAKENPYKNTIRIKHVSPRLADKLLPPWGSPIAIAGKDVPAFLPGVQCLHIL